MAKKRSITVTSINTVTTNGILADPDEPLKPGTQFGRYVIKHLLGEGGMGVVYAAYDPTLNRKIAIKVLRVSTASDGMDTRSARARMLREAQAMAMVGHPNLVQVFDVGTYLNDVYIAMEFVDGVTLRDWQANHDSKDWITVLSKYLDAARGLHAAHKCNLIHRDFKPENVMVDQAGHVRVMDFGLARHTGNDGPDSSSSSITPVLDRPLTQTGVIMGTPAYMAPEQFVADKTDHRTDQFTFCVALYEALFGHRPYEGDSMRQLARSVMRGEISLPKRRHQVPDHMLTAILKGLQTEPEDRHDNMGVLIDALTSEPDDHHRDSHWLLYFGTLVVAAMGFFLYQETRDSLSSAPALESALEAIEESKTLETETSLPVTNNRVVPYAVDGILDPFDIMAVARNNQDDIDDCVALGRRRVPDLSGEVDLEFQVVTAGDVGEVDRVRLKSTTLADRRTARCITGMSMNWVFPKPECPVEKDRCRGQVSYQVKIAPPKKKGRLK